MKTLHQILLAPTIAGIFLVICGLVAFNAISEQHSALTEINDVRFEHVKMGAEVSDAIAGVHTDMFRLVSWYESYETADQNAMKAAIGENLARIRTKLQQWRTDDSFNSEEKAQLNQIIEGLDIYGKATEAAIFMVDLDVTSALGDMRNIEAEFQRLKQKFDDFNTLESRLSNQLFVEVSAESKQAIYINVALVALAVLVSGLVSLMNGRRLMRHLGGETDEAVKVVRQIAAGDLTGTLPEAPKDSVLDSVALMQRSLREMVTTLNQNAGQLADSAGALNSAADQVAMSSGSQSHAASSMSTAIEQMRQNIGGVFNNAQSASDTSRTSGEQAQQGSEIILRATGSMERMAEAVKNVSASVAELGDSTERISSVVNVIQSVSEQTNLLALNAAIEAARAGEHGRGFAVVADEVRQLAGRAAQATDEIAKIIHEIQNNVAITVAAMQESVDEVERGVGYANDAGEAITNIQASADQVLVVVDEISLALQEQTSATDEIAQSIMGIAEMSQDNSQRADLSAGEAKAVAELSANIHRVISGFRC